MRIELLTSWGCPNGATAREMLVECLSGLGLGDTVIERVGPFPSPSVLINGDDVMRPDQPPTGDFCRLDLPTRGAVLTALGRAIATERPSTSGSVHDWETRAE